MHMYTTGLLLDKQSMLNQIVSGFLIWAGISLGTHLWLPLNSNSLHNSLVYVVSDSTLLHVPFPMADIALTRTLYTVPASRASRRVDVVEPGETRLAALQSVLRFLYSTWYSEMVTSLWGVVQVTLRAGFPECIALDTATPVTWDGTVQ